jgi:transposase
MEYAAVAWERAMKVQEVLLKAIGGELHWFRAAEILGMSPRSLRRWRERYERKGYCGLIDHRRGAPSQRRVPVAVVEQMLRLYRERYRGFNGRHFHEIARREHGITLSYTFVKQALQTAGLLKKARVRGRHRRRREPRACFGEMLHIDGSPHRWLALCPEETQVLIAVVDDATTRVLAAALWPAETTVAIMTTLREVITRHGLPMALYTDRAHWAFHTPHAKGPVDRARVTQVGRALARLGIEHIPAYSPQARGRSERLHRTFQGRLVNELRVAGVTTIAGANAYLRDAFLPQHNATFVLDGRCLQLAKQPGRRTCAGLRVTVRRHLNGEHSIWRGPRRLGRYTVTALGRDARTATPPMEAAGAVDAKSAPTAPWKTPRTRFPQLPQASTP